MDGVIRPDQYVFPTAFHGEITDLDPALQRAGGQSRGSFRVALVQAFTDGFGIGRDGSGDLRSQLQLQQLPDFGTRFEVLMKEGPIAQKTRHQNDTGQQGGDALELDLHRVGIGTVARS